MTTKTDSISNVPSNRSMSGDVLLSSDYSHLVKDMVGQNCENESSITEISSEQICVEKNSNSDDGTEGDKFNNNVDVHLKLVNYNGNELNCLDHVLNEITNGDCDKVSTLLNSEAETNVVDKNDSVNDNVLNTENIDDLKNLDLVDELAVVNSTKNKNGFVKNCDLDKNLFQFVNEQVYDSSRDLVKLDEPIDKTYVEEKFLEELCTKIDTAVKQPVVTDLNLKSLSKDDSTDIDVSYSDSLTPESDQDMGSSFVDSSYQQLQQDIENKFKTEIDRLKCRITELEKELTHELCQNQIMTMEKAMNQLRLELDLSRQEHALDNRTFANERLELESKIENLKREYQAANKDREAAVVRYACGEMELMNQKKERENAEKKLKDCGKEKEVLINKLKSLTSDKTRVCQLLDNKCSELSVAQKEIDNLKEELNSRDIKIKWLQNKLKSETDARKDLEIKVEQLNSKVHEALLTAEKSKQEAQDCIKQFQESEENKAYTLGKQLQEEQVKTMLLQHEQDENERCRKQLRQELDSCCTKLQAAIEENNGLSLKVQVLEEERLNYDKNLSQLKQKTDSQIKSINNLQDSVKEIGALRVQLKCEKERVLNSQSEMERLRQSNAELIQDMESCRKREADMLEFTQKLTAKNVRLQSEFTAVEAKVQQLESEEAPLQKKIVELESRLSNVLSDLEKEKQQRNEENKILARLSAEKTARVKTLETHVEELTNEIQLVKRKDAATIKELNRELSHLRRRAEHNESGSGNESLCHGSRTSSCTSLNDHSSTVPVQAPVPATTTPNNFSLNQPAVQFLSVEPNRQALIERIVKLQRDNAKAVEKIDFLEEHTRTLVEELQKKSKVLQSYILREEAGALSSSSMDFNKAELTKHGGIMASVYGSKAVDENMTLELSLEINRKLQAVLEDTLLKNITLKENIDTLGDEIARLTQKMQYS